MSVAGAADQRPGPGYPGRAHDFREVQRIRQWWVYALVALSSLVAWWAWSVQIVLREPFGQDPAPDLVVWILWVVVGVALPVGIAALRMVTTVSERTLRVRFWPFPPREVDVDTTLDVAVVEVRPLAHWGGYGYRRNLDGDVAFLMQGRDAVRLAVGRDNVLVVGSRRPQELAAAVERARCG